MYFYSNGQEKEGPVSLDELKQKDINPRTLIWHEGLDDWKEAETIDELRDVFELRPPPIEIESAILTDSEREDGSASGETTSKKYSVKKQEMFANPFSFHGRIRRTEFGISLIAFMIVNTFVAEIIKSGQFQYTYVVQIFVVWFFVSQVTKRCHDLGKPGWWGLIPFYVVLLIFQKGTPEFNKYGRSPKE